MRVIARQRYSEQARMMERELQKYFNISKSISSLVSFREMLKDLLEENSPRFTQQALEDMMITCVHQILREVRHELDFETPYLRDGNKKRFERWMKENEDRLYWPLPDEKVKKKSMYEIYQEYVTSVLFSWEKAWTRREGYYLYRGEPRPFTYDKERIDTKMMQLVKKWMKHVVFWDTKEIEEA